MIKLGTYRNDVISDSLYGDDDFIFALRGDDVIESLFGRDSVFAGQGDDNITVKLRDADVYVAGGRGDDSLLVLGIPADVEEQGRVTVITNDDGFKIAVRGVEHIEYVDIF